MKAKISRLSIVTVSLSLMLGISYGQVQPSYNHEAIEIPPLLLDEPETNQSNLGELLGWSDSCSCNDYCNGCYLDQSDFFGVSQLIEDTPLIIETAAPAFFTSGGTTLFQGRVAIKQPGRELWANQISLMRDHKTGKILSASLSGNLKFQEYGKLILAEQGELDFTKKDYKLYRSIYRWLRAVKTRVNYAWGTAKEAINNNPGVLKLKQATYTSCSPKDGGWYLKGKEVILNRATGRGNAKQVTMYFKKIPIFYTPYFNFPIDHRRQSGFLTPSPGYTKGGGFAFDLPYYFNLAPNYDLTVIPTLFSKRGVLLGGNARYLTHNSEGSVNVGYIYNDREFTRFRDHQTNSGVDSHALSSLKGSSSNRGLFSLKQLVNFDAHWGANIDLNYTSDDYFLQDFSAFSRYLDEDQLPNQADLSYSGDTWNFLGRLQVFQTLHPITHTRTVEQYKRLPQLNLSGDFPNRWGGGNYRLETEMVNFAGRDDYYEEDNTLKGVRFNLSPSASFPVDWNILTLVPNVKLQATGYGLYHKDLLVSSSYNSSILRLYPTFSFDTSSMFSRNASFYGDEYTQTLEPKLFYLYVPKINQDHLPNFDTYLPPFDFNQLFRTNRFNGIDRVGDANQVAVSLISRFLNDAGQEKFRMGIGQILSFKKHQVMIGSDHGDFIPFNIDPLQNERASPIVGQLWYSVNSGLNTAFDLAWDPNYQRFNTVNVKLQYREGPNQVINMWYNYALKGDQLVYDEKHLDLSRVGCSVGWKIWQRWQILGSLNYNTSGRKVQSFLGGIEYQSCCWAARALCEREFIGVGAGGKSNYNSRVYVQISFKGLTSVGVGGLSRTVREQITGYRDNF